MNPEWIIAGAAALGVVQALIALWIKNQILEHIDQLKDWIDLRYERKPDIEPHRRRVTA